MKVYIDESGTFQRADGKDFSISCVGALFIPDGSFPKLVRKYERLRLSLPKTDKGEVKGKTLNEEQVASVIELLRRNNALFEASLIDMNVQDAADLETAMKTLRDNHTSRMSPEALKINEGFIKSALDKMDKASPQLLVQFMLTTDLLHRAIQHTTAYYSQRTPKELGNFEWYVDAKSKDTVTNAEGWWLQTISPFLAAKSKHSPAMVLPFGDYSYYDAAYGDIARDEMGQEEDGTDLTKVFSKFSFLANADLGLELVDIVTNALRRALNGNLQEAGWAGLPDLVVHRADKESIPLVVFTEKKSVSHTPPYTKIYRKISNGRKSMLTPSSSRRAEEEMEDE